MKETYKKILDIYNIIDSVNEDLKTKTEEEAIKQYKAELKAIKKNWYEFAHSLKTIDDSIVQTNVLLLLKIKCIKKGYHKGDERKI